MAFEEQSNLNYNFDVGQGMWFIGLFLGFSSLICLCN